MIANLDRASNDKIAHAYDQAKNLARAGQLQRAESLCHEILREHSVHTGALLLRGVIELQTARPSQAAASFRHSLRHDPSNATAQALLGDVLLELQQPREALEAYDRGLRLNPGLLPAHFGRANALLDLQRPLEALAGYQEVLRLQPNNPEALFNRGNALLALQQYAAAVDSYDQALQLNPAYAAAHNNRGSALMSLQLAEQALLSFDAAAALDPQYAAASSIAHNIRGNSLVSLRRFSQALEHYDNALRLDPGNASAHYNRSNVLLELGSPLDALAGVERAFALKSDFTQALRARGDILLALGRSESAAQCFAQLLRLQPDSEYAPGALLHARQWCADWSVEIADAGREAVARAVRAGRRADLPFSFLSVTDDPASQLSCARTFVADRCPPAAPLWAGQRYGHDRIRVAYVSGDFRDHAVSYLLAGVFERHDRRRFETIAVSLRPEEQSALGQRVKAAFGRFIDVSGRSDREAADLLRELEIDIAVDLTGFTDGLRPRILSYRPAPIQVNYLGFPATMGAPYIDYIIADAFVIPPEFARHYSEHVVYMPVFQANDAHRTSSGRTIARADVGLPEAAFVFCCFNNGYKLNPMMFDIWMRLLERVPGSVLWLACANETVAGNLRREAMRRGVDGRRLVFAQRQPYEEYLNRLELADLFLDTLPFNGGTTASDALWAGLPVLTCAGRAFAARMAGSLVQAVGLPELATPSLEHYAAKALQLAEQPQKLLELRQRLRDNRGTAPLFDSDCFRRHLESAYEQMWRRHERGDEPKSFAVDG